MPLILGIRRFLNYFVGWVIVFGFSAGCTDASNAEAKRILPPADYPSWTAVNKREWIWQNGVLATEYQKGQLPEFEKIKILQLFFTALRKKLNEESDFAPRGWKKAIHRRGVVAKIRYVPVDPDTFGGIYKNGAIGLLRASLTYEPLKRGVAPGIAIKFFEDSQPSSDASFLNGLESQGQNYNFFAKPLSNYIPESEAFGPKLVSWIFSRVSRRTNFISVDHFVDQSERAPRQLFLLPGPEIQFRSEPGRDIRNDFLSLSAGQVLVDVYARTDEKAEDFDHFSEEVFLAYQTRATKLGSIVLESPFIASQFGDDQLFFRHKAVDRE